MCMHRIIHKCMYGIELFLFEQQTHKALINNIYCCRDSDGAVIWPIPRVKRELTASQCLPHLVQLLLTFDPILVEKVATLLCLVAENNSHAANLYTTGIFYFILMYTGSNVLPIARFLQMTHIKQAFRGDEVRHFILQ